MLWAQARFSKKFFSTGIHNGSLYYNDPFVSTIPGDKLLPLETSNYVQSWYTVLGGVLGKTKENFFLSECAKCSMSKCIFKKLSMPPPQRLSYPPPSPRFEIHRHTISLVLPPSTIPHNTIKHWTRRWGNKGGGGVEEGLVGPIPRWKQYRAVPPGDYIGYVIIPTTEIMSVWWKLVAE